MSPDEYLRSKIASPLGDRALRSRTRLITLATTATVVVHTNLVPSQIEGLGITFAKSDQNNLLVLMLLALAYCLVSFTLSGLTDFYVAKLKRKAHVEEELQRDNLIESSKDWPTLSAKVSEVIYPLEAERSLIERLQGYRANLDVTVPLVVGLYGMGALIWRLYSEA